MPKIRLIMSNVCWISAFVMCVINIGPIRTNIWPNWTKLGTIWLAHMWSTVDGAAFKCFYGSFAGVCPEASKGGDALSITWSGFGVAAFAILPGVVSSESRVRHGLAITRLQTCSSSHLLCCRCDGKSDLSLAQPRFARGIVTLSLHGCRQLTTAGALGSCERLKSLDLSWCARLGSVDGLSRLGARGVSAPGGLGWRSIGGSFGNGPRSGARSFELSFRHRGNVCVCVCLQV